MPRREFIITGTKAGSKPVAADVKEEPAANGTKMAANGKAGMFAVRIYTPPAASTRGTASHAVASNIVRGLLGAITSQPAFG